MLLQRFSVRAVYALGAGVRGAHPMPCNNVEFSVYLLVASLTAADTTRSGSTMPVLRKDQESGGGTVLTEETATK
jgi:hypothetical protein